MEITTKNNGITDVTVVIADEGKVLQLKGTEENWGKEVWLGFIHYKNGQLLEEPYMLTPEDFDEIEEPEEEEAPEVDEELEDEEE